MSAARADRDRASPVPVVIAVAFGLLLLGFGIWAFAGPASFYQRVATYPPYSRHLMHDLGAFQIGVGALVFAALFFRDGVLAALFGGGVGAVLHFVAHLEDRHLGGRSSDPWTVGVIALAVVIAVVWRAVDVRRS
jgi:hypothetical protein